MSCLIPQQHPCPDEPTYTAAAGCPGFQRFQELARVAGVSRAFTLSVKLQLYTLLRQQHEQGRPGLSAAEVAQQLELSTQPGFRGVTDWLDVLVTLDTLQRAGDGAAAVYSNSRDADMYLTKQSPTYMGGHAILYHDRTFPQYHFLEQSLRAGGTQPELARQLVVPVLQTFAGVAPGGMGADVATGGDPGAFALGMTGCNKPAFELLAQRFDFSPYKTLGDVGGSAGVLCCAVAQAHQHMTCTALDLPAVHAAAEQYVAGQGLQDRVKVADIDFFADAPLPCFDIITMGMILHDWGPQKKQLLVQKAYDALPPGGAFIALDCIIDNARRRNVWGLLMSLDMMMEFEEEGAADYTFAEFTSWAKAAGFQDTQLLHLIGPNSAAVAYK